MSLLIHESSCPENGNSNAEVCSSRLGQSNVPPTKPASRNFAITSATIGGLGLLAYLVLFMAASSGLVSLNDSTRGSGNPLQAIGNGFAMAGFLSECIFPMVLLVMLGNFFGLLFSGVALCRANGRELGVAGLLLNTFPVLMFGGFIVSLAR